LGEASGGKPPFLTCPPSVFVLKSRDQLSVVSKKE